MERLEAFADLVIRRACGFASLAILVVMLSFSFQFLLALSAGAILVTLVWLVLLVKLALVPRQDMRRSELWLMLADRHAPDARPMQAVLRQAYAARLRWHADRAGAFAALLWGIYLLLRLIG